MINESDVTTRSTFASLLIEKCPVGIIITDNSGIIKIINNKVCEISGYNKDEILDSDIDILTHHKHIKNSLCYLFGNLNHDDHWNENIYIRKRCGEYSIHKIKPIEFNNPADNEQYFIFYFDENINPASDSESKNNSESLISLGKMATYLSHEIKTPLTSIKMNIDMISRDPGMPVTRMRSMQIIKNEISRLERLSKDVLHFSRSTRNTNYKFKLNEIIDEINSLLFLQLAERNIFLKSNIEQNVFVCGDKQSIKALFLHLIENSIESIKINGTIEIWNDTIDNNFSIPVFIRDNGEGIENVKNIFEPFFTSKSTGTGLGLSIAKKIIEDHSGSIELVSGKKENTVFKITLPGVSQ